MTLVAHFRGGPLDGTVKPFDKRYDEFHVPGTPFLTHEGWNVEHYRRRDARLHPVSFLHRWGGELIETFDSFTRELVPPRMRPTDHLIYDWTKAPKVERAWAEVVIPIHLADQPQALAWMAEGVLDRFRPMGAFETSDLEWTCWPTGTDGYVRMHCETVMDLPVTTT